MRLKDFIKNKTSDIISVISTNRYLHNYKYCASIQITPDVNNILKKHKDNNKKINNIPKVKLFR